MNSNKLDNLFKHREKQVYLEFKEQEKQWKERIKLRNIVELIDDENVIQLLKKYAEQNNSIISFVGKMFYIQGYEDAKNLK